VLPGTRSIQTLLALLIPVALCVAMVGGRRVALFTAGFLAVTQLALLGILDGITLANISLPASTFGTSAPAGVLAKAGFQSSLLYICGSLPLFLGGELARPAITMRRGLTGLYVLTGVLVLLAVAPLAANSGLLHAGVPGVAITQRFASKGLTDVMAVGLALSVGGVMLAEFFALTRLIHAVTAWGTQPITLVIAGAVLVAAPLMLIDPLGLYNALSKPSLIALWLSQVIVFAVYPRFARDHGERLLPAVAIAVIASGLSVYGLVLAIQ
jgi:hypothetical protein